MTTGRALTFAAVGCMVALISAVGAIAATRATLNARQRRVLQELERWRPVVLSWTLDGPRGREFPYRTHERPGIIRVVTQLLPKVRGADRDALVDVLRRNGVMERAHTDTRSRRSLVRLRAALLMDACAGEVDLPVLTRLLVDRDQQVRHVAARALGRIGSERAIHPLMTGMANGSLPINSVSMAVTRIGRDAISPLMVWIYSDDPRCRRVAAELLGHLGAAEAVFDVGHALRDPDQQVAAAAACSLGRLGIRSSVGPLIDRANAALADGSAAEIDVCVACLTALGLIGDRRAIPVLTSALGRAHRLSAAAAEALQGMGLRRSQTSEKNRRRDENDDAESTWAQATGDRVDLST